MFRALGEISLWTEKASWENPGHCPRELPVSQEKELAVHGRWILFPASLLIYPHFASDIRQIGINSSS